MIKFLLFSILFTFFIPAQSNGRDHFVYFNKQKDFENKVSLLNTLPGIKFNPLEKGKPIIAQIGNDKKIQLVITKNQKISLNYSLEFNENQCVPETPVTVCQYSVEFIPIFISWIWIEHPNKEKINQFLKVENQEAISFLPFASSLSPDSIKNEFSKDLKFPQIQCPHLDFLPKPLGENIKFSSLDADSMEKNIFTGNSVNQGVISYFGVEALINKSTLSFVKIEKSVVLNPSAIDITQHIPLFPRDFTSLTLKDNKEEPCQITISVEAKDFTSSFFEAIRLKQVHRPLYWNEKILQKGLDSNLTNFYTYKQSETVLKEMD